MINFIVLPFIVSGECLRVLEGHKLGVYPLLYIEASDSNNEFDRDFSDLENNHDLVITGSVDSTAKSWSLGTGMVQVRFSFFFFISEYLEYTLLLSTSNYS